MSPIAAHEPVVQTPATEHHPAFSPTANGWPTRRTSRVEKRSTFSRIQDLVPASPCRLRGVFPAWRSDGAELFYVTFKAADTWS